MAGGIDAVKAGTDDGDGFATALQGAFMRSAINTKCETAGNGYARLGEGLRESVAGTSCWFGRVTAADDGNLCAGK